MHKKVRDDQKLHSHLSLPMNRNQHSTLWIFFQPANVSSYRSFFLLDVAPKTDDPPIKSSQVVTWKKSRLLQGNRELPPMMVVMVAEATDILHLDSAKSPYIVYAERSEASARHCCRHNHRAENFFSSVAITMPLTAR